VTLAFVKAILETALNPLPRIQTLEGAPAPERHADRVVAMARTHAGISTAIGEIVLAASDGTPKGQRKMEARIKAAGAFKTFLKLGTRGRYETRNLRLHRVGPGTGHLDRRRGSHPIEALDRNAG
jgi:hypothetical protein